MYVHQWPSLGHLTFADEGGRLCHGSVPRQPQCREERSPLSLHPEELDLLGRPRTQDSLTHPGPGSTPRAGHPAGLHGSPASPCRWPARPPDALPACDTVFRPRLPTRALGRAPAPASHRKQHGLALITHAARRPLVRQSWWGQDGRGVVGLGLLAFGDLKPSENPPQTEDFPPHKTRPPTEACVRFWRICALTPKPVCVGYYEKEHQSRLPRPRASVRAQTRHATASGSCGPRRSEHSPCPRPGRPCVG